MIQNFSFFSLIFLENFTSENKDDQQNQRIALHDTCFLHEFLWNYFHGLSMPTTPTTQQEVCIQKMF
jgi:hypothetical protein